MLGWCIENWNVTKGDTVIQEHHLVVRDAQGRFAFSTHVKPRTVKEKNVQEKTGSRVSRRATGLRLVK